MISVTYFVDNEYLIKYFFNFVWSLDILSSYNIELIMKGWIVKSVEQYGAGYQPIYR